MIAAFAALLLLCPRPVSAARRHSDADAALMGQGSQYGSVAQAWAAAEKLKGDARRGRGYYEQDEERGAKDGL